MNVVWSRSRLPFRIFAKQLSTKGTWLFIIVNVFPFAGGSPFEVYGSFDTQKNNFNIAFR